MVIQIQLFLFSLHNFGMKQRVAIGLSGGVDSSVAAALLIEQGYEVTGVHLTCWPPSAKASVGASPVLGCRSEEDRQAALDAALQLGIPFVHLDFQKEYKEKVFEYMMAEYKVGRTPNPDVVCNREIKFGLFYDYAMKRGYDYVATGHYAQIIKGEYTDSPLQLIRSADEKKDQTYFLHQLRQGQLKHILFPIGHLTKEEVRAEAEKRQLVSAKRPDSQGICFIGEVSVSKFLEERIERKQGKILLLPTHPSQATSSTPASGVRLRASLSSDSLFTEEVGEHRGVWFYTVGQRIALDQKKLSGFDQTNLPHFYVVKKDIANNVLYAGIREQLYVDEIGVGQMHWIDEESGSEIVRSFDSKESDQSSLLVRIRHTGELVPVKEITNERSDYLTIKLAKPVWGVAPGQSAVFYAGNACLGGGIVELLG
jgi:tRNA-uridine 2-sulfurtransferase